MAKVSGLFVVDSERSLSVRDIWRNEPTKLVIGGDSSRCGPRGLVKGGSLKERNPSSITSMYPSTWSFE